MDTDYELDFFKRKEISTENLVEEQLVSSENKKSRFSISNINLVMLLIFSPIILGIIGLIGLKYQINNSYNQNSIKKIEPIDNSLSDETLEKITKLMPLFEEKHGVKIIFGKYYKDNDYMSLTINYNGVKKETGISSISLGEFSFIKELTSYVELYKPKLIILFEEEQLNKKLEYIKLKSVNDYNNLVIEGDKVKIDEYFNNITTK
jgi:hypothetical protein